MKYHCLNILSLLSKSLVKDSFHFRQKKVPQSARKSHKMGRGSKCYPGAGFLAKPKNTFMLSLIGWGIFLLLNLIFPFAIVHTWPDRVCDKSSYVVLSHKFSRYFINMIYMIYSNGNHGKHQRQKNPGCEDALHPGKFLRVRKVFARIYKIGY